MITFEGLKQKNLRFNQQNKTSLYNTPILLIYNHFTYKTPGRLFIIFLKSWLECTVNQCNVGIIHLKKTFNLHDLFLRFK